MDNQTNMPNKTLYLVLVIVGFVLGIIWGALSVGPYRKLSQAIQDGDEIAAWENAAKIKRYIIIGVVVNVVLVIFRSFGS